MSNRKRKLVDNSGLQPDTLLKSELDLFSPRAHQASVTGSTWVDIQPVSGTLKDTSTIYYHIPANEEQYLDHVFYLKVNLRVVLPALESNKLDGGIHLAPVNLFGHAMFKRIDIKLQDTLITTSANNYPYRAYIERLLNYGSDAKSTQLGAELFYSDTAGHFDSFNETLNTGYTKRRRIAKLTDHFVIFVRLSTDIGKQPSLLPNGVNVDVTLYQSSNAFRLMYQVDTHMPKIEFSEAVLFVRRVQLASPMASAMAQAMHLHAAKYNISRPVVKEFQINSGRTPVYRESISRGQLPRTVIVGIVESSAFNGQGSKNSFNFVSKTPSFVCLYNENEVVPSIPYTLKWTEKDAIREYLSLFQVSGTFGRNTENKISYQDYLDGGYVLYGFDLSPDESAANSYGLPQRQGELSLKMIFDSKDIQQPCPIVVYMIYDNCLYIDHHRNVVTDFSA